eukprot:8792866-Pyramimonas_sp.AAC.1
MLPKYALCALLVRVTSTTSTRGSHSFEERITTGKRDGIGERGGGMMQEGEEWPGEVEEVEGEDG